MVSGVALRGCSWGYLGASWGLQGFLEAIQGAKGVPLGFALEEEEEEREER